VAAVVSELSCYLALLPPIPNLQALVGVEPLYTIDVHNPPHLSQQHVDAPLALARVSAIFWIRFRNATCQGGRALLK
jgi:hypothetical protein